MKCTHNRVQGRKRTKISQQLQSGQLRQRITHVLNAAADHADDHRQPAVVTQSALCTIKYHTHTHRRTRFREFASLPSARLVLWLADQRSDEKGCPEIKQSQIDARTNADTLALTDPSPAPGAAALRSDAETTCQTQHYLAWTQKNGQTKNQTQRQHGNEKASKQTTATTEINTRNYGGLRRFLAALLAANEHKTMNHEPWHSTITANTEHTQAAWMLRPLCPSRVLLRNHPTLCVCKFCIGSDCQPTKGQQRRVNSKARSSQQNYGLRVWVCTFEHSRQYCSS